MALALHMHRDINILGVCAWIWSFIISVDEWVVSSYFGRCPIDVSRFKNIKINVNNMCWAEKEGDR